MALFRFPRSCTLGTPRLVPLAAALLGAGFLTPLPAQNLPAGLLAPMGGVTATTSGATMTITQTEQRGIAHWSSFSIGPGATVNVMQPGAGSVLLNRVTGLDPSRIDGALNANGHIYLINPNGVMFGAGAQVNVGGIVASTLDLAGSTTAERNDAFRAGGALRFVDASGKPAPVFVSQGASIVATGDGARGGTVALMGDSVVNEGRIAAPAGSVALAAGSQITLDPVGDGLTTVRVTAASFGETGFSRSVRNHGEIGADAGRVLLLSDGMSARVINSVVNTHGMAAAGRLQARGGEIILDAGTGVSSIDGGTLDASGHDGGNGGRIKVLGRDIHLDGLLLANGSAAGGEVETSGKTFSIGAGFKVDASASDPHGRAGTWILDPEDINIEHGTGAAPANTIYDETISRALDDGLNITVATPSGGSSSGGNVYFWDGVLIQRTGTGAPLDFTINADRSILAYTPVTIQSATGAGPLNVIFNADAHNHPADPASGGGQIVFTGTILSNGGDIRMKGDWRESASHDSWGIHLDGAHLDSGTGSIVLAGKSSTGGGVLLGGGTTLQAHGTGTVDVTGYGDNAQLSPGQGVSTTNTEVTTAGGAISIHGHVQDESAAAPMAGLVLGDDTVIQSTSGHIDLTGSATGPSTGLVVGDDTGPVRVTTGGHIGLRASNDASTDALAIDPYATVQAGGMLNLRPAALQPDGTVADRTADPILLGGSASDTGFAISASEWSTLAAGNPHIVAGSAAHAGPITVAGAISTPGALTLQNEGGSHIALNGSVEAGQLGLLSAGDIVQSAAITATEVLARSSSASVILDNPGNRATTVAGSASGSFSWANADAVRLAPITVTGAQSAMHAPQSVTASSLAAATALVRTLSGDLTLAMPLSTSDGADLVAAARFQNPGGGSAGGAPWRVWADTWTGESRGAMAGSGPYPNLYGCAYDGSCTVPITADDDHFIYTQRPSATVTINDASRLLGWPNPPFAVTASGLRPGDSAATIRGSAGSIATKDSPAGTYPINGSYSSDIGYDLTVIPGTLTVMNLPATGSDLPALGLPHDSATFAENLTAAPICLASGPLDGGRAEAEGDVLAREWSRVHARPRLTNCIDASQRNACGDF